LQPLLELRIRNGELVGQATDLASGRTRIAEQTAALPSEHRRLANPHIYRVGLSQRLWQMRREMIERLG
jgi:nicotinate phosphoribosyltransferase